MTNATLRLFFALWPDPVTRAALAALARSTADQTGGRATAPGNVHLTLAFLGVQPQDSIGTLVGLARAVAAAPFALALDHVDCWRKNGVAWAGTSEMPKPLATLQQALAATLAAAGVVADDRRPFAVHVTLARKVAMPLHRRAIAPIAWPVDAMALVASDLGPGGPAYRVVEALPLARPRPAD